MQNKETPTLYFRTVSSSQIKEVAYDEPTQTLYVRFKGNKKTYSYHPVTQEEHNDMMKATSVGKYFHAHIRKLAMKKTN